jgi:hypothetical protein
MHWNSYPQEVFSPKTTFLTASAPASIVAADNTAQFVNQDGTACHVVFTPSDGSPPIDDIIVEGNSNANQQFPQGWSGNAYTYNDSKFLFNVYGKSNFFNVSAIVDPHATDGVMTMHPSQSINLVSVTWSAMEGRQPPPMAVRKSTRTWVLDNSVEIERRFG